MFSLFDLVDIKPINDKINQGLVNQFYSVPYNNKELKSTKYTEILIDITKYSKIKRATEEKDIPNNKKVFIHIFLSKEKENVSSLHLKGNILNALKDIEGFNTDYTMGDYTHIKGNIYDIAFYLIDTTHFNTEEEINPFNIFKDSIRALEHYEEDMTFKTTNISCLEFEDCVNANQFHLQLKCLDTLFDDTLRVNRLSPSYDISSLLYKTIYKKQTLSDTTNLTRKIFEAMTKEYLKELLMSFFLDKNIQDRFVLYSAIASYLKNEKDLDKNNIFTLNECFKDTDKSIYVLKDIKDILITENLF